MFTVPASPAARADTGLWKGDCAAVIIHRVRLRRIKLPVSRALLFSFAHVLVRLRRIKLLVSRYAVRIVAG